MSSLQIRVNQLTPSIGAEIEGLDLSKSLNDIELNRIYEILIEHQVVFIRNQELTPEIHLNFAKSFGDPEPPHPIHPKVEGYENIVELKNGPNNPPDTDCWHTDLTFRQNPPFTSILWAKKIPPVGGDTLWLSLCRAYETLPKGLKDELNNLKAVHDMGGFRNNFSIDETDGKKLNEAHQNIGSAIHNVIKTHPVSGRKLIFINESFTQHLIGMTPMESNRMLSYLFEHIERPDHQVRFRWSEKTLALWDNRSTSHYACSDYLNYHRVMHRVTIVNDRRI